MYTTRENRTAISSGTQKTKELLAAKTTAQELFFWSVLRNEGNAALSSTSM
jgi:hypothetical protein